MTPIEQVYTAVERAMDALKDKTFAVMDERGKSATGRTRRGTVVRTIRAGQTVVGQMEADGWWPWVGNGRGPGGMPPVDNIRSWVEAKGLSVSPWAVAKKIAAEGSRDYRQGNRNVYEEAIERWEAADLAAVDDAAARAFEEPYFELIKRAVRPTA